MIVAAAIRQDGVTYRLDPPARHGDIIHWMVEDGHVPAPVAGTQGFIDDIEGFVERERAAEIAKAGGQVERLISPPELYSEDLW